MKTHRFRLAAALTAAMIVLTALTGCMTGPRKPSSPAESAVTVDGEIRGLFIHATGQDLRCTPYKKTDRRGNCSRGG